MDQDRRVNVDAPVAEQGGSEAALGDRRKLGVRSDGIAPPEALFDVYSLPRPSSSFGASPQSRSSR
jgi:hypothetical protein